MNNNFRLTASMGRKTTTIEGQTRIEPGQKQIDPDLKYADFENVPSKHKQTIEAKEISQIVQEGITKTDTSESAQVNAINKTADYVDSVKVPSIAQVNRAYELLAQKSGGAFSVNIMEISNS